MNTRKMTHNSCKFLTKNQINLKLKEFEDWEKIYSYHQNCYYWKVSKTEEERREKHISKSESINLGRNVIAFFYEYKEDTYCRFNCKVKINGEKTNFKSIRIIIEQLKDEKGIWENIKNFFDDMIKEIKEIKKEKQIKENNNELEDKELIESINLLLKYIEIDKYKNIIEESKKRDLQTLNFETFKRGIEEYRKKQENEKDG